MVKKITGCIALLDILGFKQLWGKEGANKLIEKIRNIQEDAKENSESIEFLSSFGGTITNINTYFFSDTIIITAEEIYNIKGTKTTGYSITPMAILTGTILFRAMQSNILLRGAISFGDFYQVKTRNLIMGPAVDECAEWFEKANWIGIHLTPSAKYQYDYSSSENVPLLRGRLDLPNPSPVIINYPIPILDKNKKEKQFQSYGINWYVYSKLFEMVRDERANSIKQLKPEEFLKLLNHINSEVVHSISKTFSSQPIGPIDMDVFPKYDNTIKFFKKVSGMQIISEKEKIKKNAD